LVSSSKLLSVSVLILSDAIYLSVLPRACLAEAARAAKAGPCLNIRCTAAGCGYACAALSYTFAYSRADASQEKSFCMPAA
jgi:hypothetical protein